MPCRLQRQVDALADVDPEHLQYADVEDLWTAREGGARATRHRSAPPERAPRTHTKNSSFRRTRAAAVARATDGPVVRPERTPSTASSAKKPIMAYRELILSAYSVKPNFACSILGTLRGSGSCRGEGTSGGQSRNSNERARRASSLSPPRAGVLRARTAAPPVSRQRTFETFALPAAQATRPRRPPPRLRSGPAALPPTLRPLPSLALLAPGLAPRPLLAPASSILAAIPPRLALSSSHAHRKPKTNLLGRPWRIISIM